MIREDVPRNWAWRDGPLPSPGEAVIFDMDGVLSDAAGRQHSSSTAVGATGNRFFEACGERPGHRRGGPPPRAPRRPPPDRAPDRAALQGPDPRPWPGSVATGCGGTCWSCGRGATTAQVTRFKRDAVEELRAHGFDLRLAFEDDPDNYAMFHAEGIPCVYIHSGYYE